MGRFDTNNVATSQGSTLKRYSKLGIICAIILVSIVLLVNYVVDPFEVDGISMQPTLHTGNIVLVWRFPQTWASITNSQYIPVRSNLVVISALPITGEQLIKRVIGLPGDRVRIGDGVVTIYNSTHPNGFDPDVAPYGKNLVSTLGLFNTQVGPGQLFLMGDNRVLGASLDSRSSLGNVGVNEVIGKVIIRVWPLDQIKLF